MKNGFLNSNETSLYPDVDIKPWWPVVTFGLVLFLAGAQIALYLHSKVDGEALIFAFGASSLLSTAVDLLGTVGVVGEKWTSAHCRKIFFSRPFSWCYIVLLPYLCVVALLFVPIRFWLSTIH